MGDLRVGETYPACPVIRTDHTSRPTPEVMGGGGIMRSERVAGAGWAREEKRIDVEIFVERLREKPYPQGGDSGWHFPANRSSAGWPCPVHPSPVCVCSLAHALARRFA